MSAPGLDLRALIADTVREMVAEVVAEMVTGAVAGTASSAGPSSAGLSAAVPSASEPSLPSAPARSVPGAEHVTAPALRSRVQSVRIADDDDLDAFARQLLTLFENPKNRQDLRTGRLRFHLAGRPSADGPAAGPAVLVERGAVTERQVVAAHDAGRRIILGRRAVLTPLGREKARALGVSIEKER